MALAYTEESCQNERDTSAISMSESKGYKMTRQHTKNQSLSSKHMDDIEHVPILHVAKMDDEVGIFVKLGQLER